MSDHCPCGRPLAPAACCARFLDGAAIPDTPEDLMRSRYTAYATGRIDYIDATTDPQTRAGFEPDAARAWAAQVRFTRLEVLDTTQAGNRGTVAFMAHYLDASGAPQTLQEKSNFRRAQGRWFYRLGRGG